MSQQDSKTNQHNVLQHNAELTFQQIVEYTIDMNNKRSHVAKCLTEVNIDRKWLNEAAENIEIELNYYKPALEEAHKAVSSYSNVFKQIRTKYAPRLRSPPKAVEMTLSAVACVLNNRLLNAEIITDEMKTRARILVSGFVRLSFANISNDLIDLILIWHSIKPKRKYSHFKSSTWYQLEKLIRNKFFLQSILKFDQNDASTRITFKTRKHINEKYLSNEIFTFERINKASPMCGSLAMWVMSQVKYAHILESVEPMQQEIKQLSNKLNEKQTQCKQFNMIIKEFEGKIKVCKLKYANLTKKACELN
eukprot:123863_1